MKIIFYTGKGGVGKSTIAAATARQLSEKNRVLIVSLDPAHNLGDIFQLDLCGGEKRLGNLVLREVDLKKLSREYLQREIDVLSSTYKYLQVLNLDNYFSVLKYSPGIEEYALLISIEDTIKNGKDFDYIIFDTPPTGLTLRFLALPQITIAWIDRLIQIRRRILDKRHTIQKILRPLQEGEKSPEIKLKYDEADDEVLVRLLQLNENYSKLNNILQGNDCSIVLVFNPDILSLRESERLIEGLKELGLPLRVLVNNKFTDELLATAGQVEGTLKARAPGLPVTRVRLSCGLGENCSGLFKISEDLTKSVS